MQIPNHTQIPNIIIDNMHRLNGAEVKVFIAICRKTIGWHKISDRISYSQLSEITGLAVNSLRSALKSLTEKKIIKSDRTKMGYKYDIGYAISKNAMAKTDIAKNDIAENDTTLSKNDTKLCQKLTPQKKKDTNIKDNKEQELCDKKKLKGTVKSWCDKMCKSDINKGDYCPDGNYKQCMTWFNEYVRQLFVYIVHEKKIIPRDQFKEWSSRRKNNPYYPIFKNQLDNYIHREDMAARVRDYRNMPGEMKHE